MAKISITIDTETAEVAASMDGREINLTDAYLMQMPYKNHEGEEYKYFNCSITEVERGDDSEHRVNHCWTAEKEMSPSEASISYKKELKDGLIPNFAWVTQNNIAPNKALMTEYLDELFSKK